MEWKIFFSFTLHLFHCWDLLLLPISEDKQLAIVLYRWNGFSVRAAVYIFDTKVCQLVYVSQQIDTS